MQENEKVMNGGGEPGDGTPLVLSGMLGAFRLLSNRATKLDFCE